MTLDCCLRVVWLFLSVYFGDLLFIAVGLLCLSGLCGIWFVV